MKDEHVIYCVGFSFWQTSIRSTRISNVSIVNVANETKNRKVVSVSTSMKDEHVIYCVGFSFCFNIQYVINEIATVKYVCSNMTKSEKGMGKTLKRVAKECQNDAIRTQMNKI